MKQIKAIFTACDYTAEYTLKYTPTEVKVYRKRKKIDDLSYCGEFTEEAITHHARALIKDYSDKAFIISLVKE